MKVVYAVSSRLAGGGYGSTAYHGVMGPQRKGVLDKVISLKVKKRRVKGIPDEKILNVWYPSRVRLPYLDAKSWYYLRKLYFDRHVAKCLSKDIDIFHGWNSECLQSLRRARELGIKTVVDRASSHMLTQMKLVKEEYELHGIELTPELDKIIERSVKEYDAADFITVPSQFVYDSFIENGISKEKLFLNPFGVNLDKFSSLEREDDGVFRILFVGQIRARKGIFYLLKAWQILKKSLKGAELVLVGGVHDDAWKIVSECMKKTEFKLPGKSKEPWKFFNTSSVFVFPSIEEGSALVTYEAMASGLPSVVTYNSGSIVRDQEDGFVVPIRDVDSLVEKITYLYENRDEAKRMGENAKGRVCDYSWESYGDRVVEMYENILDGKR